ncbi:uncharacterized protein LOC143461078 isoform X1 [Clavelina lepadiformis]|uniref:uncharacterized protein LOC143461078 isoform X1 n=1 Tax=Clavelina lepadiformis TaxID=159417 RepID=UPI0040432FA1
MALCTRIFRKVIRAQLWNSPPSESRRRQFLFSAEQPRPFTFLSAVTQPDSNITAKLNKETKSPLNLGMLFYIFQSLCGRQNLLLISVRRRVPTIFGLVFIQYATRLPSLHGGSPMLDEASWLVGSANASLFLKQGR